VSLNKVPCKKIIECFLGFGIKKKDEWNEK